MLEVKTMEQIKLEFYFVYDGMIILKSNEYDEALNKAIEYYRENGEQHEYDLYSVNKYSFKDLFKNVLLKKESAD